MAEIGEMSVIIVCLFIYTYIYMCKLLNCQELLAVRIFALFQSSDNFLQYCRHARSWFIANLIKKLTLLSVANDVFDKVLGSL